MKTSKDLSRRTLTLTCEELVDAHIPYVKGVIYLTAYGRSQQYVTPVQTFNGWCCDCWVMQRKGFGWERDRSFDRPIPVNKSFLDGPLAVILDES